MLSFVNRIAAVAVLLLSFSNVAEANRGLGEPKAPEHWGPLPTHAIPSVPAIPSIPPVPSGFSVPSGPLPSSAPKGCLNGTDVSALVSTLKADATSLASLTAEATHELFTLIESLGKIVFSPSAGDDVPSEVKDLLSILEQIQAVIESAANTVASAAWKCVTSKFLPQLSPLLISWLTQTQQLSQAIHVYANLVSLNDLPAEYQKLATEAQAVVSNAASALSGVTTQLPALYHAFEGGLRTLNQ